MSTPVESPLVSVVIVSYNSATELDECLSSLMAQDFSDFEVVVLDNASSDGSLEVAAQRTNGRAKLLARDENLGFAAGCNEAAAASSGKLLVFLNPDTKVNPDWLRELVTARSAGPDDAGIWMPQIRLYDQPERIDTIGNALHYLGFAWCKNYQQSVSVIPNESFEVPVASGACMMVDRELFAQLGGFDASYFMYHEDVDLCWRARLAGRRVFCAPRAVVYHKHRFALTPGKVFYLERNRLIWFFSSYHFCGLLRLLPAFWVGELAMWAYALSSGTGLAKAASVVDIARHPSLVWRKRAAIARVRTTDDRQLVGHMASRLLFSGLPDTAPVRALNCFLAVYARWALPGRRADENGE